MVAQREADAWATVGSSWYSGASSMAVCCSIPFVPTHHQTQSQPAPYVFTGNTEASTHPATSHQMSHPPFFLLRKLPSTETVRVCPLVTHPK